MPKTKNRTRFSGEYRGAGGRLLRRANALEDHPVSGIRAHPVLIDAYGLLKLACAEANLELGTLPSRAGRAIVRAARDVANGLLNDQFVVDVYLGGRERQLHMNVNEADRQSRDLVFVRQSTAPRKHTSWIGRSWTDPSICGA